MLFLLTKPLLKQKMAEDVIYFTFYVVVKF